MIVVGGRGLPGGRMYQEFGKLLIDPHDGGDSEIYNTCGITVFCKWE